MNSVYAELRTDLTRFMTPEQADNAVSWMNSEGILDYDTLKEYYLEDEDDDDE